MIGIDELCIIASCLAKTGHKEASDLAVLSSELLTYEPLWGILKDEPGRSGRTRLMYCAKYGKTGRLRWLLKRGANPNLQDYRGYSALLYASLNAQYESVMELCRAGAKVDIATVQDGHTPLMAAAAWGHEAIVLELCRRGADTEAEQKDSGSLAPDGMEHVMEQRIGKCRKDWWNDSTWASTEGATALLLACGMGRTTVVHDLCWEGRADVNAKTVDGMTCMMFAAVHGETEIVRQLVYRGADIHAKKKNGCTALMFAAAKGHPETVQLLCEVGADMAAIDTECMNALSLACSTGCAKSVDALCRAGASVDAVPGAYEGMSPLMFAIRSRSVECVRILCAAGADVHATMACGITAPMMAISHYSPDILRFLLDYTDVDIRVISSYYCDTAIHRATELGDVESLRILLDAGLSINERTVDGKTPLMLAAGQINSDIVRILCELGADIEARDTKGLTAMDYALITKCTGSAIILQKFGAKIPKAPNASAY
jgi:ankyrin repeat protein